MHPITTRLTAALTLLAVAAAPSAANVLDHPFLGEPAPPFALESVGGEVLSLPDYEGKYLAIHFGTSW